IRIAREVERSASGVLPAFVPAMASRPIARRGTGAWGGGPMLTVETPKDLLQHVGRELGPSAWIVVDQAMIDRFADATGDHQWIHVTVEVEGQERPALVAEVIGIRYA